METTPGKRVQLLREAKGFKSLTGFAEHTGVKIGTLSALEGDKSAPSMDTLGKLLAAFPDISMDWLINGTGEMLKSIRPFTPVATPASPPAAAEPKASYGCLSPDFVTLLTSEVTDLRAENKALDQELRHARREFREDFIAQARQYNSVKVNQESFIASQQELIKRLYNKIDEYELRLGIRQPTQQEREQMQGGGDTRMEVKPFGARYRESTLEDPQGSADEGGAKLLMLYPAMASLCDAA